MTKMFSPNDGCDPQTDSYSHRMRVNVLVSCGPKLAKLSTFLLLLLFFCCLLIYSRDCLFTVATIPLRRMNAIIIYSKCLMDTMNMHSNGTKDALVISIVHRYRAERISSPLKIWLTRHLSIQSMSMRHSMFMCAIGDEHITLVYFIYVTSLHF